MLAPQRHIHATLLMALLTLLGACAQSVENLPPAPPEPPPHTGMPAKLPPYLVQVGDVLDIKLYQNPELNEEVVVRPDGQISTSIAENVQAYGRVPAQISTDLRQRYGEILSAPNLTVIVHSFAPNRVYVAGEVKSPGEFVTAGPNLTVSQAIARAGGVTLGAARGNVFVLRRGTADQPQALAVNYLDVISGAHPEADVRLAQYDVVYVPRTGIYEAYAFWNQFVQQFLPSSWGFSYVVP